MSLDIGDAKQPTKRPLPQTPGKSNNATTSPATPLNNTHNKSPGTSPREGRPHLTKSSASAPTLSIITPKTPTMNLSQSQTHLASTWLAPKSPTSPSTSSSPPSSPTNSIYLSADATTPVRGRAASVSINPPTNGHSPRKWTPSERTTGRVVAFAPPIKTPEEREKESGKERGGATSLLHRGLESVGRKFSLSETLNLHHESSNNNNNGHKTGGVKGGSHHHHRTVSATGSGKEKEKEKALSERLGKEIMKSDMYQSIKVDEGQLSEANKGGARWSLLRKKGNVTKREEADKKEPSEDKHDASNSNQTNGNSHRPTTNWRSRSLRDNRRNKITSNEEPDEEDAPARETEPAVVNSSKAKYAKQMIESMYKKPDTNASSSPHDIASPQKFACTVCLSFSFR